MNYREHAIAEIFHMTSTKRLSGRTSGSASSTGSSLVRCTCETGAESDFCFAARLRDSSVSRAERSRIGYLGLLGLHDCKVVAPLKPSYNPLREAQMRDSAETVGYVHSTLPPKGSSFPAVPHRRHETW